LDTLLLAAGSFIIALGKRGQERDEDTSAGRR
jgi:hypothetical protein